LWLLAQLSCGILSGKDGLINILKRRLNMIEDDGTIRRSLESEFILFLDHVFEKLYEYKKDAFCR